MKVWNVVTNARVRMGFVRREEGGEKEKKGDRGSMDVMYTSINWRDIIMLSVKQIKKKVRRRREGGELVKIRDFLMTGCEKFR
jgi:hypothetical protein